MAGSPQRTVGFEAHTPLEFHRPCPGSGMTSQAHPAVAPGLGAARGPAQMKGPGRPGGHHGPSSHLSRSVCLARQRIGYLAASQCFHEGTDVIMLTTNQIRKVGRPSRRPRGVLFCAPVVRHSRLRGRRSGRQGLAVVSLVTTLVWA